MFRINAKAAKGLTAALLFGLFTVTQFSGSAVRADEKSFRTTTVTRGNIIVQGQANASFEYLVSDPIPCKANYGTTIYAQTVAKVGDYVKVGDPIIEVYCFVDEMQAEELRINAERAKRELEVFEKSYNDKMDDALSAIEKASTASAKRLAQLEYEKLQMQLDDTYKAKKSTVDNYEDQLENLATVEDYQYITAPVSGVITSLEYFQPWTTLWYGQTVGYISDTEEYLLKIPDMNGVLGYGQEVTVRSGNSSYTGHIISCNDRSLWPQMIGDSAYIKLDEKVSAKNLSNPTVSYETVHIENVLKISEEAVMNSEGNFYVYVGEGDDLSKQFFTAARLLGDVKLIGGTYCVLDGLEENETVTIKK